MVDCIHEKVLEKLKFQALYDISFPFNNVEYSVVHAIWLQPNLLLDEFAQYKLYNPVNEVTDLEREIAQKLQNLVQMPSHVFWSHLLFDGNLQIFVNTFLLNCKRNYDLLLEKKWNLTINRCVNEDAIAAVLSHHEFENNLLAIVLCIIQKAMCPISKAYTEKDRRIHRSWLMHSIFRTNDYEPLTNILQEDNSDSFDNQFLIFTYICDLYIGCIFDTTIMDIGVQFLTMFGPLLPDKFIRSYNNYLCNEFMIYLIKLQIVHEECTKGSREFLIKLIEAEKPYRKLIFSENLSESDFSEEISGKLIDFDDLYNEASFLENFEILCSSAMRSCCILSGYISILNRVCPIKSLPQYMRFLEHDSKVSQSNCFSLIQSLTQLYTVLVHWNFSEKLPKSYKTHITRIRRAALHCILIFYYGVYDMTDFEFSETLHRYNLSWSKNFVQRTPATYLVEKKDHILDILNRDNIADIFSFDPNSSIFKERQFSAKIDSHFKNKTITYTELEAIMSDSDNTSIKDLIGVDFSSIDGKKFLDKFYCGHLEEFYSILDTWNYKENLFYVEQGCNKIASPLLSQIYTAQLIDNFDKNAVADKSKCEMIKLVFQNTNRNYTDAFLRRCLSVYNGNTEKVIDGLLNNNLIGGLQDLHAKFFADESVTKILQPISFKAVPSDHARDHTTKSSPAIQLSTNVKTTIIDLEKKQQEESDKPDSGFPPTFLFDPVNSPQCLPDEDEPDEFLIGDDFIVEDAQFGFDSDSEILKKKSFRKQLTGAS